MICRNPIRAALAIALVLSAAACVIAQDWLQFRGPLGQGTTTAKNLPPAAGSNALKVRWKTPIPGEGCSSPIVQGGRVYVTTAYEGTERHALENPISGASIVLSLVVLGLALRQVAPAWRAIRGQAIARKLLAGYAMTVIALTGIALAKPTWFWRFADPWTGTTVAPADLDWVEAFHVRPLVVFLFGSLALVYIRLSGSRPPSEPGAAVDSPSTVWLRAVSLATTLTVGVLLGLLAYWPEWYYQTSQPWLAWLVIGGLGLFGLAGSLGAMDEASAIKLVLVITAFAVAGWLFINAPSDEFGSPLSVQNRVVYLVAAMMLLVFHVAAFVQQWRTQGSRPVQHSQSLLLVLFIAPLGAILFVRAQHLQPQLGIVRAVVCLDAEDGQLLWKSPLYVAPTEKKHSLNSLATPTPACDEERVYAYFGSGLAALDLKGRVLWLKRDDEFRDYIRYGAGSSIALADDRILIYRDSEFMGHGDHLDDDIAVQTNRRPSILIAFDKKTGNEVWRITPAFSHDSYMTPLVWTRDGQREVVVATWKTLAGFALSDGSLRWSHPYPMQQIVPSPAVHGDFLFVTGGNSLPSPLFAIRAPTASTPAQTVWSNSKTGGNIVSPVCWNGLLFSTNHLGILTCRDAESGRIHWTKRLHGRCLASLVVGDGKLYAVDQEGTLQVFAATQEETELATLALREPCAATPALVKGRVFVRTASHLHCLGD